MLRCAVCDHQEDELKALRTMLERYQASRACETFSVEYDSSPARLLDRLSAGERCDIYILNMMMPVYNGLDVGRAIRETNERSAIVYIAESPEFALEAISVHPEQYLLKPVDPEALYVALDGVLARHARGALNGPGRAVMSLKTRVGVKLLYCREIVCVEHVGRVVRVYTQDGTACDSVYLREPFEKLTEPILRRPEFLQTHKSYMVNLNHVRTMRPTGMQMDTEMLVPISRRNAVQVRQRYLRYVAQSAGNSSPA